jgi:phytoene dehydrogenase-like protein
LYGSGNDCGNWNKERPDTGLWSLLGTGIFILLQPELLFFAHCSINTDLPTGVVLPDGSSSAILSSDPALPSLWTEDLKNRFADRIVNLLGRYLPNVADAIIGRHVISPGDLARYNPNSGPGDAYAGSLELAQSYLFRPLPGQPSHQSTVPNVFLVGAGTWPGPGVNGGSGYIVAQQLLEAI